MTENTGEASSSVELVEHTYNGKSLRIYPEVAEFFEAKTKADRDYHLTIAKLDAEYAAFRATEHIKFLEEGGAPGEWGGDYHPTVTEKRQQKNDLRRVAERKLYDATDVNRMDPSRRHDPANPNVWADFAEKARAAGRKEIVWMLDHTLVQQPYETEIMLHYLPNNTEVLWQVAKEDHDFCAVFDRFMEQAEASGIFTDVTGQAGMKEFMALQSFVRRNYGNTYARDIGTRVGKIMKIMREEHAKEMAAAKAEWQGLDEAWRSERARRAAATRAANRAAQETAPQPAGPKVSLIHPDRRHIIATPPLTVADNPMAVSA